MGQRIGAFVFLFVISACAGKGGGAAPDAAGRSDGPWFCQTNTQGDGWDCTRNPPAGTVPRPLPATVTAPGVAAEMGTPGQPAQPGAAADPERQSLPDDLDSATAATSADTAPYGDGQADGDMTAAETAPGVTAAAVDDADSDTTAASVAPAAAEPAVGDDRPLYQRLARNPATPAGLGTLPDNYYAVQVIALDTPAALEAFASERGVTGLGAARVASAGRILYVLLLGVYENLDDALAASASLPESLADLSPWIRSVGDLKQAMRQAEGPDSGAPDAPG
jgi:septal ring-binding cell division protein DamX